MCESASNRRSFLKRAAALGVAGGAFTRTGGAQDGEPPNYAAEPRLVMESPVNELASRGEPVRITRLETILVQPRWLFLKIHTDAGVTGWGEPIVEGRALTMQTAVDELAEYLVGKDPRNVVHHWQAMYRHAFYRGGPVLTSAISGIDMALWDIKGKLLGVPVYELLGGPTRHRVRVYAHVKKRTGPAVGAKGGRIHRIQDRSERRTAIRNCRLAPFHPGSGRRFCGPAGSGRRRRRDRDRLSWRHQSAECKTVDQGAGAVPTDVH